MKSISFKWCFLSFLALTCHLQMCVGECIPLVVAKRKVEYVPEGGAISLWCDVQHCGQNDWTGGWGITTNGQFSLLFPSHRIHLSNQTMSADETRLVLNIHNINQSDSGLYQCNINWQDITNTGHVTKINVTAGYKEQFTAGSAGRITFDRVLVCAAASLCIPLILGLTRCLSSSDTNAPPVPPRSRNQVSARVKPDTEVKYAAIVLNGPRHQNQTPAVEPTVYSVLNFPV